MAKKQFYLTVDTETTQDLLVADFAAVVSDRKGAIVAQCAVLINGIFTDPITHPLFFDSKAPESALWSRESADRRYALYSDMVKRGTRLLASVTAVNRWLEKANATYSPTLTAYNLPFDKDKCGKTGIDLNVFAQSFCLWSAAQSKWGTSKKYRQFILENHLFNNRTDYGNLTFKTNAEVMCQFLTGNDIPEPHTALEDVIDYELPILNRLVKNHSLREILEFSESYDWRKYQVKDWFVPR